MASGLSNLFWSDMETVINDAIDSVPYNYWRNGYKLKNAYSNVIWKLKMLAKKDATKIRVRIGISLDGNIQGVSREAYIDSGFTTQNQHYELTDDEMTIVSGGKTYYFSHWLINNSIKYFSKHLVLRPSGVYNYNLIIEYSSDQPQSSDDPNLFFQESYAREDDGVKKIAAILSASFTEAMTGHSITEITEGYYYVTGTNYDTLTAKLGSLHLSEDGRLIINPYECRRTTNPAHSDQVFTYNLNINVNSNPAKYVIVRGFCEWVQDGENKVWLDDNMYALVWNDLAETGGVYNG